MDLMPTAGTSRAVYDPAAAAIVREQHERDRNVRERPDRAVEEITVKGERPDDTEMSFWDLIDFINPLQHIPVVNTIYRELTGDTIKTPAKLVGSTLLAGPIGFATAMADSIVEEKTGKDMGGHVMAMLRGDDGAGDGPTQLARERSAAQATQVAAVHPREFIPENPDTAWTAAGAAKSPPSQAESMITAAQIAAKAQVAMPVRSYGEIANADLGAAAAAPGGISTAALTAPSAGSAAPATGKTPAEVAAIARARAGRFMPLNAEATKGRDLRSPVQRSDTPITSVQELRARARFAPGPMAVGGDIGARSAATVEAVALKSDAATLPDARAQFDYAVNAAQNTGPVDVPGWFDQAMMSAIDKYNATAGRPATAPAQRKLY